MGHLPQVRNRYDALLLTNCTQHFIQISLFFFAQCSLSVPGSHITLVVISLLPSLACEVSQTVLVLSDYDSFEEHTGEVLGRRFLNLSLSSGFPVIQLESWVWVGRPQK